MRARTTGLIVLVACALSACGGGGGDDGSGDKAVSKDEQQVRAVLKEALTTKDPDSCTRLLTQALVEQISAKRGAAAVRDCREDADTAGAKTVSIDRVRVNGPRAGSDVRPKGGSLTFKTLSIGLRKDAGRWKLDRLKGGTLDRPAFVAFARKELTSPPDAVPADTVDCMLRDVETTEDEAIARALLSGDARLFLLPITICGVRNEFARRGTPAPLVECIVGRVRRAMTTGELGRRLAASPESASAVVDSPLYERAVRLSAARCARDAPAAGEYQPTAAYP